MWDSELVALLTMNYTIHVNLTFLIFNDLIGRKDLIMILFPTAFTLNQNLILR